MDKARLDQWLWSVRIFKSRTKATEACKNGKVTVNGVKSKASTSVVNGDHIGVNKNRFLYEFIVREVIRKRVSASLAADCYEDITPAEELKKFDQWYIGKSQGEFREKGAGRPTKKERRAIEEFKKNI